MLKNGGSHIQFMADMLLVDRVLKAIADAETNQAGAMVKQAFDLQSTVSDIMNTVKSSVTSQIDTKNPVKSVVNFLAPAMFFRLHWALGLLVTIGQMMGFNVVDAFTHIVNIVTGKIQDGKPVSPQDVEQAGREAVTSLGATASSDFFYGVRALEERGYIEKIAVGKGVGSGLMSAWNSVPWIGKNLSPLQRLFTFLAPGAAKNLIVGILVMAVKTILLSGGLMVGGGLLMHYLAPGSKSDPSKTEPGQTQPASWFGGSQPSGPVSQAVRTRPGDSWIVNLRDKDTGEILAPDELIFDWAADSYPEIEDYEALVRNNPTFKNAVRAVTRDWFKGTQWLTVPNEFSKPSDIIGLFIQDVLKDIRAIQSQSANQGVKLP